ncbi:uncharacterized protein EV154DRAFT_506633 [Mucor mucedo]|uniref:uncharacterized protein n=1 Tax=Mucor mucedo TaxID=29922 RepID=UPI00221E3DBF|nr:uncharacterized protein EV154DRAFT_506633 [Mucor mucedo]KAI7891830.1 hypothetical protein EV154DRAFT_506633 [Mucor mucedo]
MMYSPESTEKLLFEYLRPQLEKKHQEDYQPNDYVMMIDELKQPQLFLTACWDDTFLSLEEEDSNIMIELNTFSDLKVALKDIEDLDPLPTSSLRARAHQKKCNRWSTTEEDLINLSSTNFTVPPSVRLGVENSQMLDMLMHRAVQHWCCIGFKVAPVNISVIQNWRTAPRAIVYCIASISLVTFMDRENTSSQYSKQAAMVFYEQARNKMDDILFDDMQPMIIQSYFCLSYTSNLLRLYEQQRTWGGLASISLQHLAKKMPKPVDKLTLGCWFRWYYVDAWMCLTLNRDCLLPDIVPLIDIKKMMQKSITASDEDHAYSFAMLTHYMRRYIRALHSGKIFSNDQQKLPSLVYYQITGELTQWYDQLPRYSTIAQLHLHICYNSMRLVVLYQFLTPQQPPTQDVVIDCLQTNLELLQALQQLKDVGCDQSTYHHMFFAIHNTAKRIFQYNQKQFKGYAEEQLKINLMLLKSTQAYVHDVFKMKIYAEKIQDQFTRMKIYTAKVVKDDVVKKCTPHQSKKKKILPALIVFRREEISLVKKSKKK